MAGKRISACLFLLIGICAADAAHADTIVTQWSLVTGVNDSTTSPSTEDAVGSFEVMNPFTELHETAIPDSVNPTHFANTQFVFAWNEPQDTGVFDIAFDQQVGGPSSFALGTGTLRLTSTAPLLLDLSAVMNFTSNPGDEASFLLSLSVTDITNGQGVFGNLLLGGNAHFGQPASGTLAFSADDILLPAGATYRFLYNFRSLSPLVANLNGPMLADGFINWSFTPVPEPSTAAWPCRSSFAAAAAAAAAAANTSQPPPPIRAPSVSERVRACPRCCENHAGARIPSRTHAVGIPFPFLLKQHIRARAHPPRQRLSRRFNKRLSHLKHPSPPAASAHPPHAGLEGNPFDHAAQEKPAERAQHSHSVGPQRRTRHWS